MNLSDSKVKLGIAGVVCGIGAVVLAMTGNPGNMAICIACFIRDTAGALGMHQAAVVQYARPEIIVYYFGCDKRVPFNSRFITNDSIFIGHHDYDWIFIILRLSASYGTAYGIRRLECICGIDRICCRYHNGFFGIEKRIQSWKSA